MLDVNSLDNFIDELNEEIKEKYNIQESLIVYYPIMDNKKGRIVAKSIWLCEPATGRKTKMMINYIIKGRADKKFPSFSVKNIIVNKVSVPNDANIKVIKSDTINTYVEFKELNESAKNFVKDVIIYYVENFEPSDKFGCCSKYKECSVAKKCLHKSDFYARACWYRKNLKEGKIFY